MPKLCARPSCGSGSVCVGWRCGCTYLARLRFLAVHFCGRLRFRFVRACVRACLPEPAAQDLTLNAVFHELFCFLRLEDSLGLCVERRTADFKQRVQDLLT